MQTTDNQRTINILKQILGEYDYLKYDEELSAANQFINGLAVKVTHPDLECSNEVASKIARQLGAATGECYVLVMGPDSVLNQGWTSFVLSSIPTI